MEQQQGLRITARAVFLVCACLAAVSPAAGQAPETDILVLKSDGLGGFNPAPQRITNRPAYDNQPKFLPDGRLVFTAAGQSTTEIHVYDFDKSEHSVLFSFPENLYSATPVPGEAAVSVIRDYGNQVQQLWKFPLDGSAPTALQADINPIGYHAWIDAKRLILFVLAQSQDEPQTLQLMSLGSKEGVVLHHQPGRALASIPIPDWGSDAMSFTRPAKAEKPGSNEQRFEVVAYRPNHAESSVPIEAFEAITLLPGASQDYAWAPDGVLWIGRGTELLRWDQKSWAAAADLAAPGIGTISRLAWSADGQRLAVVVERTE